MKQGKQLTTGKRIIFFILVVLAVEVALFIAGFFMGFFEAAGYDINTLLFVSRAVMVASFIGFAYLLYRSFTTFKRYQESEDDDDVLDQLYKTTFRSLEYSTILYNIFGGLVLANMILGANISADYYTIELFDIAAFIVLLPAQVAIFKVTQVVRQYKLSAFPTPSEIKDYIYALDEGERQANFEQSYLIVHNLNQWVLPLLYLLIMMVTLITQTQQLLALLIVAFLHIYINVMQVRMIRRYFK
ncbi:DUF3169 family protein [Streptococcus suis]|uniref:DUF3169 family protein n=1 Tax=Streptococcus suis TaxID=1307 RepID=UPI0005CE0A6B|nr:DUF3169 family protein [Streptococcus suis]MCO8232529.1 DUF3169 family protein [Streptococcus suis]NQO48323.1 DUF3169 family protein [Streptococcus suis]NQR13355.1 DUF3169 family protein [Streptococcus suis]NQS67629.1 DUF3169 family protein [Streptococcus suis]CYW99762.1 membrane protein [Streptococcus suis]